LSDDKEKVSANIEDYLKTIYQLSENDELVKTTSIAKNLNIAPGSVISNVKKIV
jgi:DtxR family Mn-dependent transcriptional regulator